MSFKYGFLIIFGLWSWQLSAQFQEVHTERFQDKEGLTDLSELLYWGSNSDIKSAFTTSVVPDNQGIEFQSIFLTSEAIGMGGYNSKSAYTSTAFDILFEPLSHQSEIVSIEFDYFSELLSGNGESGRLGIALLYDYPEQGPQFADVFNTDDEAPFGRPAYNLRLLNGVGTNKQAYLFYGGGNDYAGEFERTGDQIWLPGFISGPGGTSPGSENDYPLGPVKVCNSKTVSDSKWIRYTWLIYPEKMEVYSRDSETDSLNNRLLMSMSIPFKEQPENEILSKMFLFHGRYVEQLPTLYNWFDGFEGVRFYFRSIQNGYLANVRISTTDNATGISAIHQKASIWDDVAVYPTVVDGVLNIQTAGRSMQCNIMSIRGQTEMSLLINNTQIDLSYLKSGLYFVSLTDEETRFSRQFKIIKK